MPFEFGDCVFDQETRELARGGRAVDLSPKAFALLSTLLAERPRALSKSDLHQAVWPGTFVSDSSLARLVSELRTALGDTAGQPRFVRTVHGFGYAFTGEVTERGGATPYEPACWLVWGRRVAPLRPGGNLIGRSTDSVVAIDSSKVSRRHTSIRVLGDQATLTDLGSKNGTYVEGTRVTGPVVLSDGDQIAVGSTVLTFRCGEGGASTETELSVILR